MSRHLFQGDVFNGCFDDEGDHPLIVVSREFLNRGDYAVVVPTTSKRLEERRHLPHCVFFLQGESGFTKDCVARADQIFFISRDRIDFDRGLRGRITGSKLRDLIKAIGSVICADCEPLE